MLPHPTLPQLSPGFCPHQCGQNVCLKESGNNSAFSVWYSLPERCLRRISFLPGVHPRFWMKLILLRPPDM